MNDWIKLGVVHVFLSSSSFSCSSNWVFILIFLFSFLPFHLFSFFYFLLVSKPDTMRMLTQCIGEHVIRGAIPSGNLRRTPVYRETAGRDLLGGRRNPDLNLPLNSKRLTLTRNATVES